MSTFCTISTTSHLFKTYALANSLSKFNTQLAVLLVDKEPTEILPPNNVTLFYLNDIVDETGQKLIKKYSNNKDKLRWGLKPVFIKQQLQNYAKVIYVDNDTYFYSNPAFLFSELDENNVLLTPHFYPNSPKQKQNWLEANFKVGLYNAGFFAANQQAIDTLNWWADCCLYNITKSTWRGIFDDQKYLDLLPVKFNNIKILKHLGCNLAGWNYADYNITKNAKNDIVINEKDALVFMHFAEISMICFSQSSSPLNSQCQSYISNLQLYKPSYKFKRKYFSAYNIKAYCNFLWWKMIRLTEK